MPDITEEQIKQTWNNQCLKPKVSICCISFNQEEYIKKTIDSFLAQKTSFAFEIVISDDVSTDKTAEIIQKYARKYPSVINFLDNKENLGANNNFLRAINNAKGEYIAFCEGDDYWIDVNKLQIQYTAMLERPEVNFSFHPCFLNINNKLQKRIAYKKGSQEKIVEARSVLSSLNQFSPTASYMFKREVIGELPEWFALAPVGDLFIELYCMRNGGGLYLPKPMSVYRVSSIGSWTNSTQQNVDRYTKRHLALIDSLRLAELDFPDERKSFTIKIAYIYLSLAIRMLKQRDYDAFRIYITNATTAKGFLSIKHCILYMLKSRPALLNRLLSIKKLIK
ncbi:MULTISPECIES: glycosyltransferase [Enterobacterales]|uniref:glycosyltransferase n=1 Tax=Enterobacterales TaxID=91347 RepID=UPI002ED852B2